MNRLAELLNQSNMVPIKRGCENESCFCTGECQKVIGYREKHPLEKVQGKWLKTMSTKELGDGYEESQRELKEQKCTTQKNV